jgi:small subunit ribosomal protein S19
MSRSLKKGPYVDEKLLRKVERARAVGDREPIKTWARACTIVPEFVGQNFLIHNGRSFIKLFVTEDMVGHKLGEFAPTRVFRGHGGRAAKDAAAAAAGAPAPAAKG